MIGAIVQARMTSTRLPGKTLLPMAGKPALYYVINQLRQVKSLGKIVLAITTNRQDDPLEEFAATQNIPCYRGSEDDVLDRFYCASLENDLTHIMRITADCPLLDPAVCEKIIGTYFHHQADFVHTGQSYAEGLDCGLFSLAALAQAHRDGKMKSDREHVDLYIHHHPEIFKIKVLENDRDDSHYRLTLDEELDYKVIKAVIEGLASEGLEVFNFNRVKKWLDAHPEILKLNCQIIRNEGKIKSLAEDKPANNK
jgi:spore coat polysaccharide biosynthesis protein SpsF (cytidylyltransferase family)